MASGLEHLFVVGRLSRFQEEYLDQCTCRFTIGIRLTEVHTGLNHLRIVEYHQCSLRQVVRQMIEHILPYLALVIDEKFGMVAPCDGKLRDTLIRQVVLIIADTDMSGIGNHLNLDIDR